VGDIQIAACQSCCRRRVRVSWPAVSVTGLTLENYILERDGVTIATLEPGEEIVFQYIDDSVVVGSTYTYTVTANIIDWEASPTSSVTIMVHGWRTADEPASNWHSQGCDCDEPF